MQLERAITTITGTSDVVHHDDERTDSVTKAPPVYDVALSCTHKLHNRTGFLVALTPGPVFKPSVAFEVQPEEVAPVQFDATITELDDDPSQGSKCIPITHVDIINADAGETPPRGWTLVNKRICRGPGTPGHFLIYKRDEDCAPIVDLFIRLGESATTLAEPIPDR
jgi:hypothetical protein